MWKTFFSLRKEKGGCEKVFHGKEKNKEKGWKAGENKRNMNRMGEVFHIFNKDKHRDCE